MYDVTIIGPATKDENVDYTGEKIQSIGGAVYYSTFAAKAAGANVFACIKISENDKEFIKQFELPPEQTALLPSEKTTQVTNTYFTKDRERRIMRCISQSDPIFYNEIPKVESSLFHLAGLFYGDFPSELIIYLSEHGKVSVDIQGFLRYNKNGEIKFHDWPEKDIYFPYFDFLKADAVEAEILTGTKNRHDAAKLIYDLGAKEIMISHHSEILIYDGNSFYNCPIKSRNLSGRTGRGDTTFGSYIARRMLGESISDSLAFATAMVSLKMETPGPFRGTEKDVRKYQEEFYD